MSQLMCVHCVVSSIRAMIILIITCFPCSQQRSANWAQQSLRMPCDHWYWLAARYNWFFLETTAKYRLFFFEVIHFWSVLCDTVLRSTNKYLSCPKNCLPIRWYCIKHRFYVITWRKIPICASCLKVKIFTFSFIATSTLNKNSHSTWWGKLSLKGRIIYEGSQMTLYYRCFSGSTIETKLNSFEILLRAPKTVSTSQQMPTKFDSSSLAAKKGR